MNNLQKEITWLLKFLAVFTLVTSLVNTYNYTAYDPAAFLFRFTVLSLVALLTGYVAVDTGHYFAAKKRNYFATIPLLIFSGFVYFYIYFGQVPQVYGIIEYVQNSPLVGIGKIFPIFGDFTIEYYPVDENVLESYYSSLHMGIASFSFILVSVGYNIITGIEKYDVKNPPEGEEYV